jgi:hypothetical protein
MKRAQRDRIGASRGKLALVGVLAVVLVYVLASNLGGADGASDAEPTQAAEAAAPIGSASAANASAPTSDEGGPFGEFAEDHDWPKPSPDQLTAFDPMEAPPWMAPIELAAAAESGGEGAASLEELRNAQSAIIFIADGKRVARIGSQDYHVGDFVGPYQITDISSAGIVLSEPMMER